MRYLVVKDLILQLRKTRFRRRASIEIVESLAVLRLMENTGIEPATSAVQGRRSSS